MNDIILIAIVILVMVIPFLSFDTASHGPRVKRGRSKNSCDCKCEVESTNQRGKRLAKMRPGPRR